MDYEIEVVRLEPEETWMVRGRAALADLPDTIGDFLDAVARRIDAEGSEPIGAPYTRYHDVGEEELELEAGFPVPEGLGDPGEGVEAAEAAEDAGVGGSERMRVRRSGLPGGDAARTEHWGSYEDLPAAAAALGAWIARNRRKAAGARWEVYWTDPTEVDDASEIRTDVYVPLEPNLQPS